MINALLASGFHSLRLKFRLGMWFGPCRRVLNVKLIVFNFGGTVLRIMRKLLTSDKE